MTLQILTNILIRFFVSLKKHDDPVIAQAAGVAKEQLERASKFTKL